MKGKYAQGRIRQKTTLEKWGNAPNGGNRIYRKPQMQATALDKGKRNKKHLRITASVFIFYFG
jgi:hypothetical protein